MTTHVVDLQLTATPEQAEIVQCEAKMIGLFAGRRWGKSVGVVRNRIIMRCLSHAGLVYLLCAPGYSQVKAEFDAIHSAAELGDYIRKTRLQPYPVIYWDNGSVSAFRSLDRPDLIRGPSPIGTGYDEVWIDECQDVEEDAFLKVLRPLVADRRGVIGISGQFRGTHHWTYKRFYEPGQVAGQTQTKSWRYPTGSGFSFRDEEGQAILAEIERTTPRAVFEQEYLCLPTANSAAVFRPADLDRAKRGDSSRRGLPGRSYVIGLDLGRVADPSAIVVIDAQGPAVVWEEERPLGEYHADGANYAAKLSSDFGGAPVLVDATGGATGGKHPSDEFVKEYRKVLPNMREFIVTRDSKERLVHALALALEQGRLAIPADLAGLHTELAQYEYSRQGDRIIYHGPKGHKDNRVAACMLAWYATANQFFARTGRPIEEVLG
jgi:hypothetical protein